MIIGRLGIALTIVLTVYSQLVAKWVIRGSGPLPEDWSGRLHFVGRLFGNPWIWSMFAAAFLASIAWWAALSKLDLSYAYPFMSLSFALVFVASAILFREPLPANRIAGLALIVLGVVILGR